MNHVDNPLKSPAILSLCTGMRGLERGIERSIGHVRTVAYVEIEAFVVQNLVAQMESGILAPAPIWSNLKTFPSALFRDRIHGIIGGYPCQPFSHAGKRKGEEDPRHLWPYIYTMVGTIRPVWCFFENVAGHLTLGYQSVRQDLQRLGYKVEEGIFSAEEAGAPHQRKRLFILALANSVGQGLEGRRVEADRQRTSRGGWMPSAWSGSELGDADSSRESQLSKSKSRGRTDHSGKTMADADNVARRIEQQQQGNGGAWPWNEPDRCSQWPARLGQPQYEWEEPRTEPGLGYTVNGYNFREDLLRMAGNAVVPQQAEIAFRILLRKFISN